MRFALDGIPLEQRKTGVGHYTFELARSLAYMAREDEFEVLSPSRFPPASHTEFVSSLPSNLRIIRADVNSVSRRWWWSIGLPLYSHRAAFSLFHGTNFDLPLWSRCPTVLTIHALTLFLYPETHEEYLVRRARGKLPLMARIATVIITPSEAVKREVCEQLGVRPEKVVPIPEAARSSLRRMSPAETSLVRRRLGIEDEFILFVGTIEPRKNLLNLARAFDEILKTTACCPQLVIAGKEGWLSHELS